MSGRWLLRLLTVAAIVSVSLVGTTAVASAKAHRHRHHGSGNGAPSAPMMIQVDPDPLVEIGSSAIDVVIQVETSPAFAGDTVDITSSQLDATCSDFTGFIFNTNGLLLSETLSPLLIPLVLDNEGNATIDVAGGDCAPGSDVIEASMTTVPYYTAVTTLVVTPPAVTAPGVFGFPTSSGTVSGGEVETGDGGISSPSVLAADSNVFAVFYVETDPVYAEQNVTVSWSQLADRCATSNSYAFVNQGFLASNQSSPGAGSETSATLPIDDDGNVAVIFVGSSCAAGSSVITADVDAGTRPTYVTTFNILPPQPTI